MRLVLVLLVLGGVLMGPPRVWAILGIGDLVYDPANHETNIFTSFQALITAGQSILQSGYMLTNLESWGSSGYEMDSSGIRELVDETNQVLWDIRQVELQMRAIFGLEGAPESTMGLEDRLYEIRRIRAQAQADARRIQTLPKNIMKTIEDLGKLWGRILGILGEKQGSQQIQELLTRLNETEAQTGVVMAAFQNAVLTDAMEQPLIEESMARINRAVFLDYPARR